MKINQSWFQRKWVQQFHFLRLLLYFFGDFFTYRVMRRLLWQCWSCCYWWGHYWCSRSAWNCFEIWARLTNTWWTVWIDNSMLCIWHNWASWLRTEKKKKYIFSISVWKKAVWGKGYYIFGTKIFRILKRFFYFQKTYPTLDIFPFHWCWWLDSRNGFCTCCCGLDRGMTRGSTMPTVLLFLGEFIGTPVQ